MTHKDNKIGWKLIFHTYDLQPSFIAFPTVKLKIAWLQSYNALSNMQRKNFVVMAWTLLYKMITKAWHEWGKDFTIRMRYLQAATINKRRWKDAFLIFYVLSLTPSEFCFALVIFYHDLRTLSACRSPFDKGLFVG